MYIIQCEKCKATTEPQKSIELPTDWRELRFNQGYPHSQIVFHLCPKCIEAMGLPKGKENSLGIRIIDIISEIAEEAVDNR